MHTGPQYTSPQQAGGNGGRGAALLIGVIAFAVVFLLIVGVTVGYLVLRPQGGGGPAVTSSSASGAVDPETTSASETESPTPTDVVAERCWSPERSERTSTNPSGKLRGGGLQFIPPALYDLRSGAQITASHNPKQYNGVKMVREDGQALGLKPQFSILDSDDVVGILKDAAGGTTDVATARQWQWTISSAMLRSLSSWAMASASRLS